MLRTRREIQDVAKGIVNALAADVLTDVPGVSKCIDKFGTAPWGEMLDEFADRVNEILLTKFGSSD